MDGPVRDFRLEFPDDYLEPRDYLSHPVEAFRDPRESVRFVNPDYVTGSSYQVNCTDAARCFERTWRGHAEEAAGMAPKIESRDTAEYERAGRVYALSASGLYVDGEPSSRTEQWAGHEFQRLEATADLRDMLQEHGHGSSAIVHSLVMTEDGKTMGHAYNVVNHEGTIKVVDAQTHEVLPFSEAGIRPGFGPRSEHRVLAWDSSGRNIHV